jgi:hypothetical protein
LIPANCSTKKLIFSFSQDVFFFVSSFSIHVIAEISLLSCFRLFDFAIGLSVFQKLGEISKKKNVFEKTGLIKQARGCEPIKTSGEKNTEIEIMDDFIKFLFA